jgi:hypothetical protein
MRINLIMSDFLSWELCAFSPVNYRTCIQRDVLQDLTTVPDQILHSTRGEYGAVGASCSEVVPPITNLSDPLPTHS